MTLRRFLLAFPLIMLLHQASFGQQRSDSVVTVHARDMPIPALLSAIESKTGLRFDYDPQLLAGIRTITLDAENWPVGRILETLNHRTGLEFVVIGHGIVIRRAPAKRITVSGFVRDEETDEYLMGATVYLPDQQTGTITDKLGFYSISLPPHDSIRVVITYVGHAPAERTFGGRKDIEWRPGIPRNPLQEQVTPMQLTYDPRDEHVTKNQASMVDLGAGMLSSPPSYGSNADLMAALQLLPGVQTGVEGTTGYSVRGGTTGHNIVLLNDATIYNPSHLFGLVGIFNPESVKSAVFLKGGFPAGYGDHLSSVLDVSTRDGSTRQPGGSLQIGNITSGVSLYGPLAPAGSSYFAAFRRSMIDCWIQPFSANNYFNNYFFYDADASLNFRTGAKDRLLLSFYKGMDHNDYSDAADQAAGIGYNTNFGNLAASLRWNHLFSPRLTATTTLAYTDYHQFIAATQQGYFAQLYSGIRDRNLKSEFSWYPTVTHKIKAGIDLLYQSLFPAASSNRIADSTDQEQITPSAVPPKSSGRIAAYLGDDMELGRSARLYMGLRVSDYLNNDVNYLRFEPRLSFLYLLNPTTSIKASWSRMQQYIHLVQTYNASFPAEVWIGSSPGVAPESSDEYTLGLFKNLQDNNFQLSLESYYKKMDHQDLLRGATTAAIDNNLENRLIFGKAWSYGAEWMIRKNRGRWKGWLAYTLAWAWQQFDSLNQGKRFPYALDRRNSIDLSASYAITDHWKLAASFYYADGRAFSLNNAKPGAANPLFEDDLHESDDNTTGGSPPVEWETNNFRLSPYNRLDLSVSYHRTGTKGSLHLQSGWTLTFYNVYAYNNTEFAYRTIDPLSGRTGVKQVSFLPVIPCLSYHLAF